MKGWMTLALLVTFLSGGSTGFLVGRTSAPTTPEVTFADRYVEQARKSGVTGAEDLEKIRSLVEQWEADVLKLTSTVEELLKDQLTTVEKRYRRQIEAIIDSYSQEKGD